MSQVTVRIYFRNVSGEIEDSVNEFDLSNFAGFLPSIGDTILDPGVPQGLDRRNPKNRQVWTVVDRIFNPRDLKDYITLVVTARPGRDEDTWI